MDKKINDVLSLNDAVITDYYVKQGPELYPDQYIELNNRMVAMHNLYEALYSNGILKNISFEYREYDDVVYFAFKLNDILDLGFNKNVLNIAMPYIKDCICAPCKYTGAIQPGKLMQTYRNNNGCVGKSTECFLAQWLDNEGCNKLRNEKSCNGTKNAVKLAFELACFK